MVNFADLKIPQLKKEPRFICKMDRKQISRHVCEKPWRLKATVANSGQHAGKFVANVGTDAGKFGRTIIATRRTAASNLTENYSQVFEQFSRIEENSAKLQARQDQVEEEVNTLHHKVEGEL